MKNILLSTLLLLLLQPLAAQVPVIRSNAKTISVRDGVVKSVWNLSPESNPDIYYTALPRKKSTVSFITDIDSISFDTEFGKTYDFVILNGKDSCRTRISANYNGVYFPTGVNDTIPFFMMGSRIYFNGQINNHPAVIQLDLGAGTSCVNIHSAEKTGVKFDATTSVSNTNGINEEPLSSKNTLVIGKLKWEQIPFVQVRNMNKKEDLIVGNSLFESKVIAIDYDKKIFIVSDKLNGTPTGYSSHDVVFEQHRPKIEASVNVAGKVYTDWFLFDTGRDGSMVLGYGFNQQHQLWKQYTTLLPLGGKKIVVVPEVIIAGMTFKEVVTNAIKNNNGRPTLLGNELLNYFNVVLDNPNGVMYLKPNDLANKHYTTYRDFKIQLTLYFLGFVVLLMLMIFIIRRMKKAFRKI